MLNDPFQRGVTVKVLGGIAAGEHVERSLILELALAPAEDRRRDIARKTRELGHVPRMSAHCGPNEAFATSAAGA
ncbi:hypothetical protein [Kribbella endophytica]